MVVVLLSVYQQPEVDHQDINVISRRCSGLVEQSGTVARVNQAVPLKLALP